MNNYSSRKERRIQLLSMLLIVLISSPLLAGFNSPVVKDRPFYEKTGQIVWDVHTEEKKIAFTFDDGPDPKATKEILDLLKKYNAKATFFVLGSKVEQNAELIKRELAEGHEVANHTYSHIYFDKSVNTEKMREEIVKTQQALEEVIGFQPKLFRPPGGYYNERSVNLAKHLGYTTILWSWHQDTNDWRRPGVDKIVNKVLKNVRNGDIILMHDYNPGTDQTVKAFSILLPALIDRGFQFVTVSELIQSTKSIPINK